jgi:hypothetical protein
MNALRTIQKPLNGKLIIEVPKDFENDNCEVIVLKIAEGITDIKDIDVTLTRYEVLQKFKGIAKDSTYNVGDDEVYNQ